MVMIPQDIDEEEKQSGLGGYQDYQTTWREKTTSQLKNARSPV